MWTFVFRIALLASSLVVAWNILRANLAVLRAPSQPETLPAPSQAQIAAQAMAEEATRHVTAIEVAIAQLGDQELWGATSAFTEAVGLFKAAVLTEPRHYRRAKRYLGQILIATEQTTKHFARHYQATPDPGTRRQTLALMSDLATAYRRAATQYAQAGAAELEVEAETIKDLLRRNRL